MPLSRRARPRSRRCSLQIEHGADRFRIWLPPADDELVLTGFGDAASLAFELLDWGAEREVLVLLDARRRVTAMLLDPPPAVGLRPAREEVPGLEVEFCQTLSIVLGETPVDAPPTPRLRDGYHALRRVHVLQGLQLLDVILAHPERVQSLAIACDPDPVWFEPFEPLEPALPDDLPDAD